MKNLKSILFLFASVLLFACGNSGADKKLGANHPQADYICPMDTDVVSDSPGKCTKCGMDLVENPNHHHDGEGH
jgi:Cu(I)/Ag(I) efflux system membrane fusion protein